MSFLSEIFSRKPIKQNQKGKDVFRIYFRDNETVFVPVLIIWSRTGKFHYPLIGNLKYEDLKKLQIA